MTNRIRQLLVASLSAVLAAGAGACRQDGSMASDTKIVGTTARTSEADAWPSTVAITRLGRLQCTGTLVAPTLILTAAHCLPEGSDPVATLRVHVGSGAEGGRYDGELTIVAAGKHPDSRRGNVWGAADIAFLVLAEPLNVPVVPVAHAFDVQKDLTTAGAEATVVGFGIYGDSSSRIGVKHEATTTLKHATAQEVFLGDSGGDACGGDSGGPAFGRDAEGAWYQFGVTSRGPTPCGSDLYPGAFSLIAPHVCWIEKASGLGVGSDGAKLCQDIEAAESPSVRLAELCRRAAEADPAVSCVDPSAWARTVESLDLSRSGIRDLSFVSAFANVQALNLEDNDIRDLSALQSLPNLKDLRIGWNAVESLAPVASIIARGGQVRGQTLQNGSWRPPRRTTFLELCQEAESGESASDQDLVRAMLAVKRAACLGGECGCYTANDNLHKSRAIDLSDARSLKTLLPLKEAASLQYLTVPPAVELDPDVLATLENLRQVGGRAWPE